MGKAATATIRRWCGLLPYVKSDLFRTIAPGVTQVQPAAQLLRTLEPQPHTTSPVSKGAWYR